MTTLITGAGLVGSQIARMLQEQGEKPVLFDIAPQLSGLSDICDLQRCMLIRGDVLNPLELLEAVRKTEARRIIHTVANPRLTAGAQENPYRAIQLNIMGAANVLEAARILKVERVVLCSSSVLYQNMAGGEDKGAPGKEEDYPRPGTFYAATKQAAESIGLNYAKWCGVDVVAVRFAAVFGPWAGPGGGVATEMMRGWLEASLKGEEAALLGTPVEFVYSKDAARGALLASQAQGLKDRVFNIGMGEIPTPQELGATLKRVIPSARPAIGKPVQLGPTRLQQFIAMDSERSRTQLKYEPAYPMQKALQDYKEWIVKHR